MTTGLPEVVLCDIDGTVAINDGHRGHYEWHKVGDDKPNVPVLNLVRHLREKWPVIFVSGRMDDCYHETFNWLYVQNLTHYAPFPYGARLLMRKSGDYRPDNMVKQEIYEREIKGQYDVVFVLDDRDQVVGMWRELGLTCLQVAEGNF